MTVPSEQSSIQYDADGVSVSFPVPFRFIQDSHLRVTLLHADVETVLVLGSDYSVSGANDPAGGTVTTAVAYPLGDSLTIERIVPITQETHYQRNDPFPERAHEQALDKLTMIIQQVASVLGMTFGSTLRALLLGAADKDGSGAYRANGNRIQNLGYPRAPQDAVNMQAAQDLDNRVRQYAEELAAAISPGSGTGAFRQLGQGTVLRTFQEKMRDTISVLDFGAAGDGATDDTNAIQAALDAAGAARKNLFVPAGRYGVSRTLYVPAGISVIGEGKRDMWGETPDLGSHFFTIGSGNPQRWTDVDGDDAADDTPLFVACGNGVYFRDIAISTPHDDPEAWSMGLLFPCVKQCGISNFLGEGFTDGVVYLDATWSHSNNTLKSLHPEISPSTGMNEFFGQDVWLIAGGSSGFAIKIQGTTRPGDFVSSVNQWQWGGGGTSDIRFIGGRISGRGENGGCFSHDAQLFGGPGNHGQGVTLRDIAMRLSREGRYAVKVDRSNRIILDGIYAETVGVNTPIIAITSRTQLSTDGVIRLNDKINASIWLDGEPTGVGGSTTPWAATRCLTTYRVDGRTWTPNIEANIAGSMPLRLASFAPSGAIRFASRAGGGDQDFLRLTENYVSPEVPGGVTLGTASRPFGISNLQEVRYIESLRPTSDNQVPLCAANYRASVVYAGTGTINTSDERFKAEIKEIDSRLLDAWGDVGWAQFKFLDAIQTKGAGARWHFGAIAQHVRDALAAHGIDGVRLGLLCFDQWDAEYEPIIATRTVVDEDGVSCEEEYDTGETKLVREAGDRWGVRYGEALVLEAAYQRRENQRLRHELDLLKGRVLDLENQ